MYLSDIQCYSLHNSRYICRLFFFYLNVTFFKIMIYFEAYILLFNIHYNIRCYNCHLFLMKFSELFKYIVNSFMKHKILNIAYLLLRIMLIFYLKNNLFDVPLNMWYVLYLQVCYDELLFTKMFSYNSWVEY